MKLFIFILYAALTLILPLHAGETKPQVAATTSILGDVVKQVAGDAADVLVLMPPGTDPHHYEPSARDLAVLSAIPVIFLNGLGLESSVERHLMQMSGTAGSKPVICAVSKGLHEPGHHERHGDECGDSSDPHVWTDPTVVKTWVDTIASTLTNLLPDFADVVISNATNYKLQLDNLDAWIKESVSTLPQEERQLVTDHHMLHYFAERYGFRPLGMILPSYSTASEPSARDLATLQNTIREHGVKAVFIAFSSNPVIAGQLARDTGARVVPIYSGTLGEPGSGVESYIDYMKYNTRAIVEALRSPAASP